MKKVLMYATAFAITFAVASCQEETPKSHMEDAKENMKEAGEDMKEAGEKAGEEIKEEAQEVKQEAKQNVKATTEKAKDNKPEKAVVKSEDNRALENEGNQPVKVIKPPSKFEVVEPTTNEKVNFEIEKN